MFKIYHYTLPLKQIFSNAAFSFSERKGFIVELLLRGGGDGYSSHISSYAEIAPLPNFHKEGNESFARKLDQIKTACNFIELLIAKSPTQDLRTLLCDTECFYMKEKIFPSVQFGIDCLLVDYAAKLRQTSFCNLLRETYYDYKGGAEKKSSAIRINYLYDDTGIFREYLDSSALEPATLKIKIKSRKTSEEISKLNRIRSNLPINCCFRLDCNQLYSVQEAYEFIRALEKFPKEMIEYIEEPLNSHDKEHYIELVQMLRQSDAASIPFALDESLSDETVRDTFLSEGYVLYYILKPSVLGGINSLMNLMSAIHERKKVVITTAFESQLMTLILSEIIMFLQITTSSGLFTDQFFSRSTVVNPAVIRKNCIVPENNNRIGHGGIPDMTQMELLYES